MVAPPTRASSQTRSVGPGQTGGMGHTSTTEILAAARALGPQIEAAADEIDAQRCLPESIVAGLRDAGVFRVAFPTAWGGPEMPILEQVHLVERLAYHDAST